jgi:hypothetical protein
MTPPPRSHPMDTDRLSHVLTNTSHEANDAE